MESNSFLILQTLTEIGLNKLMTVNTSKSGLSDTFSSNLKLFFCVSTSFGNKDPSFSLLKHILNVSMFLHTLLMSVKT